MNLLKPVLVCVLSVACIAVGYRILYPAEFEVGRSVIGSVLSNEIIGEMLPFQEKTISSKPVLNGKYNVSSVCHRNLSLISAATIYLDVVDLERGTGPIRSHVADKDVLQDCTSFEIQSIEVNDDLLTVNFFQDHKINVKLH